MLPWHTEQGVTMQKSRTHLTEPWASSSSLAALLSNMPWAALSSAPLPTSAVSSHRWRALGQHAGHCRGSQLANHTSSGWLQILPLPGTCPALQQVSSSAGATDMGAAVPSPHRSQQTSLHHPKIDFNLRWHAMPDLFHFMIADRFSSGSWQSDDPAS